MEDKYFAKKAVELAGKSKEEVGCACIIVLNGKILAEEYNSQNTDQLAVNHAEIKAVSAANKLVGKRKLKGAVAYCSCEPCMMCVSALSYAKINKIVYVCSAAELFPDDEQSKTDKKKFLQNLITCQKLNR